MHLASRTSPRWVFVVVCFAVVAAVCHGLAQDETTDNATDSCPPIPNCGIGYTCKVVKHPDNCPICKCVPCDDKPCVPKEGFGCTSIQMATGCRTCRCEPCRELKSCEAPCTKVRNAAGCPICDCFGTKGVLPTTAGNPEVENMPFDYQNDADTGFEP